MSDEFLYRLREPPRPEFAAALRERIFREPPGSRKPRGVRLGLAALLLAVILVACATPQIRTPILHATETAVARARVLFATYKVGGSPRLEVISPGGDRAVVTIESMSVAEAQERVPFQIRLPTWVPEGLEMNPLTVIPPEAFGDWVIYIGWRGPYSGGSMFPDPSLTPLSLQIAGPKAQLFWAMRIEVQPTPTGMISEEDIPFPPVEHTLEVSGKPVYLAVDRRGSPPTAMLSWVQEEDGVAYTLIANLEIVSLEDLIRVAEMIR
ncbi:MAG: hypothetical protein ACP5ME_12085 [Anaerolineae bacterium]